MKLELPEQKKWIHTMTVPIRWGDMDVMGHVNNTLYFRYMEIARVQWLLDAGAPVTPEGEAPVVVNAFCNFTRQLEFPGDVIVRSYVGAVGRTSVDVYQEMAHSSTPDVVSASGGATLVWFNFQTQKSTPLPDWLRQILQA